MNALAAGDPAPVRALVKYADQVTRATPLGDVLDRLDHGAGAVPVADDTGTVTGWVRHRDLLNALSRQPADAPHSPGPPRLAANRLETLNEPHHPSQRRPL